MCYKSRSASGTQTSICPRMGREFWIAGVERRVAAALHRTALGYHSSRTSKHGSNRSKGGRRLPAIFDLLFANCFVVKHLLQDFNAIALRCLFECLSANNRLLYTQPGNSPVCSFLQASTDVRHGIKMALDVFISKETRRT